MQLCVLGRQSEFGLAELESLYGADRVRPFGDSLALVDTDVDFARLGSVIACADVIAEVPALKQSPKLFALVARILPDVLAQLPAEGKLKLGVSCYDIPLQPRTINAETLKLKKIIRAKHNRSVRIVPNDEPALSSAQVYHNKLTGNLGVELILATHGDTTIVARTRAVQDIDSYRIRDRERPKRDAFVGMLPPKLAQTLINLAVSESSQPTTILDPFCGTGVVLQEALLMGYDAYGSDLSNKMIDYSRANLVWLQENPRYAAQATGNLRLEQADARDHIWRQPITAIACEGYLGQPLGGQHPTPERLDKVITECNGIATDFIANIAPQLDPDARLAIAFPAWVVDDKLHHLPLIAHIEQHGFIRQHFRHAEELLYHRDGQTTAREIIVLKKT